MCFLVVSGSFVRLLGVPRRFLDGLVEFSAALLMVLFRKGVRCSQSACSLAFFLRFPGRPSGATLRQAPSKASASG